MFSVCFVSSLPSMLGSARGSSAGVGGSESSCVETELIESFGPPRNDCLVIGAFCGLGNNFNPKLPPSVGKPATPKVGDTACAAGLLIRLGNPSIGLDAVNTLAPYEVDAVRDNAGDCLLGVTFPDEDRRGIPIMGPLGPGAYSPLSRSSICEGGENQPLREEVVSLAGEGVGEVGSA